MGSIMEHDSTKLIREIDRFVMAPTEDALKVRPLPLPLIKRKRKRMQLT